MDFRRLSGNLTRMTFVLGKRLSALGFIVFTVAVVGEGCSAPTCPAGWYGPVDNRDRTQLPHTDEDWICLKMPEPVPPPPPPDLGGFKPADPPGPRDRDAVMKAAIFIESCTPMFWDFSAPSINAHIDAAYRGILYSVDYRAIFERVNCFKDKTNGCDAVRECLGIAKTWGDPGIELGCKDGLGVEHNDWDHNWTNWANCAGLGLECYATGNFFCATPRKSCDPELDVPTCIDGDKPRNCTNVYKGGPTYAYEEGSCADYGVTCAANESEATCTGLGPACGETFKYYPNWFFVDYRAGIACENATTLRACVNGHEQLVDCTKLGEGFQCFGGTHPQCGYDFQCDPVDWKLSWDLHFSSATCEGSSITVCNSGVRTTIDCQALGFETCDPDRGVCKSKPPSE